MNDRPAESSRSFLFDVGSRPHSVRFPNEARINGRGRNIIEGHFTLPAPL
jgi:hypothetical protein